MGSKAGSNKRIFVIEDAIEIRVLLKRLLESEGYVVEGASNGQEALEILRSQRELPAVILLDLMMPVMDGYEFREVQKRDERLSSIPVVVMTADGHIDAKKMRVDAPEGIRKPLSTNDLFEIIEKYC